jgi:hypothetical protein
LNILQPNQWTASTDPNNNELQVGGSDYWVQNAGKSWSLTSPAANTLRFEVRPGDVWSAVDPSSKERSEIAGTTSYAQGTQLNVSYGFQVEPGVTNNAPWLVVGQFHQTADTSTSGWSPPFEIDLNGDKMSIVVDEAGGGANSWSAYKTVYTDSQNITRGHTYAMQITADFGANGYLHVVRDGVTLVDYHGPMGYSGMGDVYWKEGIYRGAASTTIAADYSNLSVTTGSTPPPTTSPSSGSGSPTPPPSSGSTYTGTAATVSSNLDSLNGDTSVSSVVISDNAAVKLSVAQLQNDTHVLGELTNANGSAYTLDVQDTGSHLSAALSALASNSHVSSIQVTDGAVVTVASSQYSADTAVLNKITGAHTVEITGYSGTGYSTQDMTYDSSGHLAERTYHNTDGSISVTGLESGLKFQTWNMKQTVTVSNSNETFVLNAGFGAETIKGYQPGHDMLVFDHNVASSASAVFSHAHGDGHGGTLVDFGSGHTIDLVGITLSQFKASSSDLHFF